DGLLGVDVMFDEMSYREMEYALKEVLQADGNRVAAFRVLFLGDRTSELRKETPQRPDAHSELNDSQHEALKHVLQTTDAASIHGTPRTGKTTPQVYAIYVPLQREKQALVCAPSNAAVDLLDDKPEVMALQVLRIGHPARVTEHRLSKTLDARIAAHPHY